VGVAGMRLDQLLIAILEALFDGEDRGFHAQLYACQDLCR
jgi:hypothetical protein